MTALEHDLFLFSPHCNSLWVLLFWLRLWQTLSVPSFPPVVGALFDEALPGFHQYDSLYIVIGMKNTSFSIVWN
jgi:hypothetical protein